MRISRTFSGRVAPPGRPTEVLCVHGRLGEPSLPQFISRPSTLDLRPSAGFTMVEIAICLAIIGIALVAIIGVLPIGINVQKDNREETVIDQDASVFIENIRNGARGLDDLTNYVSAISNSWTLYKKNGTVDSSGVNGYTYTNFSIASALYPTASTPLAGAPITNGLNIIGLL